MRLKIKNNQEWTDFDLQTLYFDQHFQVYSRKQRSHSKLHNDDTISVITRQCASDTSMRGIIEKIMCVQQSQCGLGESQQRYIAGFIKSKQRSLSVNRKIDFNVLLFHLCMSLIPINNIQVAQSRIWLEGDRYIASRSRRIKRFSFYHIRCVLFFQINHSTKLKLSDEILLAIYI